MRGGALALLGAMLHLPALAAPSSPSGPVEEQVTLPLFGAATIYRPEPVQRIRGVVLFVSGDGGWNLGVVDMARRAAPGALVVGLSMPAWRKQVEKDSGGCWFPAGDLESTAQMVEKIYKLPRYVKPILVGYSSGATVVYAALAQAPAEAFAGAISLGFCPDLEVARPACGRGAWKPSYDAARGRSLLTPRADLAPRPDGAARWTALQGTVDQVCDAAAVARFTGRIPAARMVGLPKVGHGFLAPLNWGAAYDAAVEALLDRTSVWDPIAPGARHAGTERSPEDVRRRVDPLDLPLEVIWPEGARDAIVFLSGDGGWAELDQKVSSALAERGIAVVGWNSLRYFWSARDPEEFRADLARLVEVLPRDVRLFLGGYSFGAEVAAVSLARSAATPSATAGALSRIAGLVLLAPGRYATFEVSPLDWLRGSEVPTSHGVTEAIEATDGRRVLCLESSETRESGCPKSPATGVTREVLPGGHHFAGDFGTLAARVLDFIIATSGHGPP